MTNPTDEQLAQALVKEGIGSSELVDHSIFYSIPGDFYDDYHAASVFVTDPRVMDAVMEKAHRIRISRVTKGFNVLFSIKPHDTLIERGVTDPNRSRAIVRAYLKARGDGE